MKLNRAERKKKHKKEDLELLLLKKQKQILEKQVLKYDSVKKEVTVSEFLQYLKDVKKEMGTFDKEWANVGHIKYIQ